MQARGDVSPAPRSGKPLQRPGRSGRPTAKPRSVSSSRRRLVLGSASSRRESFGSNVSTRPRSEPGVRSPRTRDGGGGTRRRSRRPRAALLMPMGGGRPRPRVHPSHGRRLLRAARPAARSRGRAPTPGESRRVGTLTVGHELLRAVRFSPVAAPYAWPRQPSGGPDGTGIPGLRPRERSRQP